LHSYTLSTGRGCNTVCRFCTCFQTHITACHCAPYRRLKLSNSSSSEDGSSSILRLFKALPSDPPAFPYDPNFSAPPGVPLKLSYVYAQVQQQLLSGEQPMAVMVDTSDSMLRTHTMKLPAGTPYELQVRPEARM
jgi:hypothetical protein